MPDKAIDVMDEAGAATNINGVNLIQLFIRRKKK
jgi:ATP-dependent Clp protease ATP-binding subunit ClpA